MFFIVLPSIVILFFSLISYTQLRISDFEVESCFNLVEKWDFEVVQWCNVCLLVFVRSIVFWTLVWLFKLRVLIEFDLWDFVLGGFELYCGLILGFCCWEFKIWLCIVFSSGAWILGFFLLKSSLFFWFRIGSFYWVT